MQPTKIHIKWGHFFFKKKHGLIIVCLIIVCSKCSLKTFSFMQSYVNGEAVRVSSLVGAEVAQWVSKYRYLHLQSNISTYSGSHRGTNDATLLVLTWTLPPGHKLPLPHPPAAPSASTVPFSLTSEMKEAQMMRDDLLCSFLCTQFDPTGEVDVSPPPCH